MTKNCPQIGYNPQHLCDGTNNKELTETFLNY